MFGRENGCTFVPFQRLKISLNELETLQGGPFDGTEKGPLDGTERGPLDGTAVCFSANFFRKKGTSMVQRDFQKKKFLRLFFFFLFLLRLLSEIFDLFWGFLVFLGRQKKI